MTSVGRGGTFRSHTEIPNSDIPDRRSRSVRRIARSAQTAGDFRSDGKGLSTLREFLPRTMLRRSSRLGSRRDTAVQPSPEPLPLRTTTLGGTPNVARLRAAPPGAVILSPGDRLGPYQIVCIIGAGGMGEVYRARDARLKRDVALKVLYRSAASPEHLQLLSREARAAGSLNHPNIPAVFDVDIEAPIPYVVSELLEGESLRQRLDRGPVPLRKALEYGAQIANALAAAHEKGIYHRDVKPGNVFVTLDGRVKLLDFGLAKLERGEPTGAPEDTTVSPASRMGAGCGTAGYMAPEQVLGDTVDARTDLFALGSVLYEMFSGVRAFRGPSPVETMHAVLHDEPVDLLEVKPGLKPAVVRLVRRCLEKNRQERFQCAHDLAFALEQLQEVPAAGLPQTARRGRTARRLALALALAAVTVLVLLARAELQPRPAPTFQQITFQRGSIGAARFAPGGDDVLYSAAREGRPLQVWQTSPRSPESRPLGYLAAHVLAAKAGELALLVRQRETGERRPVGTLAVASLGGGAPRELLEDVVDADWAPGEAKLAVVRRRAAGPSRLEYPPGHVLYESPGTINNPRVARDGQRVAFLEDRTQATVGGVVAVVDLSGARRELTREWPRAQGLAWSPRGDEVWFTAGEAGDHRALRAVDLQGRQRLILPAPESLTLRDTATDGRVLLTRRAVGHGRSVGEGPLLVRPLRCGGCVSGRHPDPVRRSLRRLHPSDRRVAGHSARPQWRLPPGPLTGRPSRGRHDRRREPARAPAYRRRRSDAAPESRHLLLLGRIVVSGWPPNRFRRTRTRPRTALVRAGRLGRGTASPHARRHVGARDITRRHACRRRQLRPEGLAVAGRGRGAAPGGRVRARRPASRLDTRRPPALGFPPRRDPGLRLSTGPGT